jgi:GNAT superfamily N-acetyltransferase
MMVRPLRLSDAEPLRDMLYRLSDESTYQRFFEFKKSHPREEIEELVDSAHQENVALVATTLDAGEVVGMARYDLDPATQLADVAFVVADAWQKKGIGTALMRRIVEIARARGVAGFTADVLPTNELMLAVFNESGLEMSTELEAGICRVRLGFREAGR